jgi:hypothetical protein
MLALSFLILIGVMLIAEGFGQHIPKGYIYFAMAFSVFVEMLDRQDAAAQSRHRLAHESLLRFGGRHAGSSRHALLQQVQGPLLLELAMERALAPTEQRVERCGERRPAENEADRPASSSPSTAPRQRHRIAGEIDGEQRKRSSPSGSPPCRSISAVGEQQQRDAGDDAHRGTERDAVETGEGRFSSSSSVGSPGAAGTRRSPPAPLTSSW